MVSYTSVPHPGNIVFGTGMSITGALIIWTVINLHSSQERCILRISPDQPDRASYCCGVLSTRALVSKLNMLQLVLGIVVGISLAMLAIITLEVDNSVHGMSAGAFFLSGYLHLMLVLYIQTRLSGSSQCCASIGCPLSNRVTMLDEPTSLSIKRWVFRLVILGGLAFAGVQAVLYAVDEKAVGRRWVAPLMQWTAILLLMTGFGSYGLDISNKHTTTETHMSECIKTIEVPDTVHKKSAGVTDDCTIHVECKFSPS